MKNCITVPVYHQDKLPTAIDPPIPDMGIHPIILQEIYGILLKFCKISIKLRDACLYKVGGANCRVGGYVQSKNHSEVMFWFQKRCKHINQKQRKVKLFLVLFLDSH